MLNSTPAKILELPNMLQIGQWISYHLYQRALHPLMPHIQSLDNSLSLSYTQTHTHTHAYTYTHKPTETHTNMSTHTHKHTHTFIDTHTHTPLSFSTSPLSNCVFTDKILFLPTLIILFYEWEMTKCNLYNLFLDNWALI